MIFSRDKHTKMIRKIPHNRRNSADYEQQNKLENDGVDVVLINRTFVATPSRLSLLYSFCNWERLLNGMIRNFLDDFFFFLLCHLRAQRLS